MADQTKNTIVSELDERLDSLFGEDVGDQEMLGGAPLESLKSLVMTIDWEISESTLSALLEELESLRSRYADNKPVSILLKMMTSLSGYVQKHKADSHPESIQLFHSVAKDLTSIVEDPGMDPRTRNAIVKKDIDWFQSLKSEIVSAKKEEMVSPPSKERPGPKEEIPVFKTAPEVGRAASAFKSETRPIPEPKAFPFAPPAPVEDRVTPEGAIEFKEDLGPALETAGEETGIGEAVQDYLTPTGEETLETPEEERIPEYEVDEATESDLADILEGTLEKEAEPEYGAAPEISVSTPEDLRDLDEIFREELSRVEEHLEEDSGFESIPSPEELGIDVDAFSESRVEDAEPLVLSEQQEELAEVFELSEEPIEEMDSLFAEQPGFQATRTPRKTMEAKPAISKSGIPAAPRGTTAPEAEAASLQPILEAIQALGRELRGELDTLRSEVNETKDRLNQLLEYRTELPPPRPFDAASQESFDLDFETREDDGDRLFSGEGIGLEVPEETQQRLGFKETSLEDIFEDEVAAGEREEPEEETKTLQELFEEAIAPRTTKEPEIMDFEFEGDDQVQDVVELMEESSEKLELEDLKPAPHLPSESDFVAVTLGGRDYVLPADYVVKTGKVKDKTRVKIVESGRATIEDLRSAFQSIKKGVFPAWRHISQKELRQLSFPVVWADEEVSEDQAGGRGIVLLRSGDRCGTLLADEAPVRVGAEDAEGVELLDVERLLSSTRSS
ncbi:MAG: hypothetical protein HY788_10420 [Deltaproteobacteria bacterium]|nr:hypothetical protein [Deltaproteobacteria bacterium]